MELMNEPPTPTVSTSIRPPRTGRFAAGAIIVVLVLALLHDLIQVITISTGRVLFALGGSDGRLPLSALPQLLQADLREGSHATLADAALSLRLLAALPSLVHAVTITAAAILLIGILHRVSLGRPFSGEVLGRWRWLTVVLLAGGVIQSLADTGANIYLSTHLGLLGARYDSQAAEAFLGGDYSGIGINVPQWPISILLAGVIALALGAAFRAGGRLEEEVDGVV